MDSYVPLFVFLAIAVVVLVPLAIIWKRQRNFQNERDRIVKELETVGEVVPGAPMTAASAD